MLTLFLMASYNEFAGRSTSYYYVNDHHYELLKRITIIKIIIAAVFLLLTMILGATLPASNVKNIPYWTGLILLLSGISGTLIMILYSQEDLRRNCTEIIWIVKLFLLMIIVAGAASCLHCTSFALQNLENKMECTNEIKEGLVHITNCICTSRFNETEQITEVVDLSSLIFKWTDKRCNEATNVFNSMYYIFIAANSVGFLISFYYLYLHWTVSNYKKYAHVRHKDNF